MLETRIEVSGKKAIVIDGHRSWLDLAERVLSAASIEVVGTAMSLREGTRLLEELRPSLAVVETAMKENGADALSWLSTAAARFPNVKLIAASESRDLDAIRGALTAGAAAVVMKSDTGMDLAAAVRQTDERSFFLRSEAPPAAPISNGHTPAHGLTRRELEILRLAAQGLSNGEIAKQLWVTEQTVKFHLANTYRKLGVSNRTGAARQAQLQGLLTEE